MNKIVISLTDEELTYLMNKTCLQLGEYKVVYSEYEPKVSEKYVITFTAGDINAIAQGTKVEYSGFIFEHAKDR